MLLLLLPADPLDPRRADEHFRAEGVAARAAGHAVGLVDHDALAAGRWEDAVVRLPGPSDDAVYRGWMLRSEQYARLEEQLGRRDVRLRTSVEHFRAAHELPGWATALADVTPESVWTDGPDLDAFERCCRDLGSGAAVLRDFTRSLKHHWDEAAYVPDVADVPTARAVAAKFLELRGDDLVGGLVLRRFERFVSAEARTWWVDGECRLVTAHPDTPSDVPPAPALTAVAPLVARLGLAFVTLDVVLRDDGAWRVVELGDGQVSDRPSSTPAEDLLAAIVPRGLSGSRTPSR
ncbi:ATP-grasp domain-containing protein [Cellulomonas sp. APG4]|uniref:ATP-grasp domain-containing protein n=1 Tax=Cellulomonas sp. APG4 TaxID=1538656 RepID=UPI00137ACC78|nr:ATP-grasp domain-containing protein [Cellulomonas sp. APG4]NCT91564.1 ATP-grasp domain-containing protein [Cellulomonas sp. APG4]